MDRGFVGADPLGLLGLADTVDQYACRVRLAATDLETLVAKHRLAAATTELGRVERILTTEGAALRWRARAIENAQQVAVHSGHRQYLIDRGRFAASAVFDLSNVEAAFRKWSAVPSIDELAAMTPAEVSAAFAAITPSIGMRLARSFPAVIGSLDGAPPRIRYLANAELIRGEIEYLRSRIARLRAGEGPWTGPPGLVTWYPVRSITDRLAARYEARVTEYERWLAEGRQILLFDPHGDGRVVEVFGDLDEASNIGVVVPGMGNDLSNFSDGDGGFRINALRLWKHEPAGAGQGVATIAWLGYDTPDGIDAGSRGAAADGAGLLRRFVAGIDPQSERTVTVVSHSYGSVVAGMAAGSSLGVDNLVFIGSPGTTLENADAAILRPGGRVWAGLAEGDPIAVGVSPEELPPLWVPPALMPSWFAIDMASGGAEELWHGANPASDEFGALRISTDGSSGHSAYFEGGSLQNLGRIVRGLYAEVDLVE